MKITPGKLWATIKKSGKTPAELKTQGGHVEKLREHFAHISPPQVKSSSVHGDRLGRSSSRGKGKQENPSKPHHRMFAAFYHGLPQSTPSLIPADGAAQTPHHQVPSSQLQ